MERGARVLRAARFARPFPLSCLANSTASPIAASCHAWPRPRLLSPDAPNMREGAFTRRLERQTAWLERDMRLTADTLALFIRH